MKLREDIDNTIYEALKVEEKPSQALNKQIIDQISKQNNQKSFKTYYRRVGKIAIAAAVGMAASISVYATWRLLSPSEIATTLQDSSLALAFDDQEAIMINESKVCGPYLVTLQGIVSGKAISDFANSSEAEYPCRTYTVISIAKTDGTKMDENFEDSSKIFVSPYIKGVKPWQCNVASMNGGSTQFVKEGVLYRVIECDNIEIFADRGLYMGVSLNGIVDNSDFVYNDATGELSGKTDVGSESIVFDLPIDKSKGDAKLAEEYLKMIGGGEDTEENNQVQEDVNENEWPETEELIKEAVLIEESVLEIDQEGMVHYEYSVEEGQKESMDILVEAYFEKGEVKNDQLVSADRSLREWNNGEIFYFITLSQDEQGDITAKLYKIDEK